MNTLGTFKLFSTLFGVIKEWLLDRPSKINEYPCFTTTNHGQSTEGRNGRLMHHHGHRVEGRSLPKTFQRKGEIWQWTRSPCGTEGHRESIIYGPYSSTDITEPGNYRIDFYICALGLPRPTEILIDDEILEVDVNKFDPNPRVIASRPVRVSDLAQRGWIKISVKIFAQEPGTYEYRIFAYDGTSSNRRDNLAELGNRVSIYFDKIVVWKLARR